MSFSIDSLLKRDDFRGKERVRSKTGFSNRMRRQFHYDIDDIGGVIAYRGESAMMSMVKERPYNNRNKVIGLIRTGLFNFIIVPYNRTLNLVQ